MLKLKRIKLQQFEEDKISSFSMNQIWDGATCGCHYANSDGSQSADNDAANYTYGYSSIGGGSESCGCTITDNGAGLSAFWKECHGK